MKAQTPSSTRGAQLTVSETYRLNQAILSIHSEPDGNRSAIMIPAGSRVTVVNGPLDGQRMVDVLWTEKTVMIFTVDLRARGTLIGSAVKQAL
jgi:hypothetical protein